MEKGLINNMINAKINLGLGLKKRGKSKWTDQLAEELHKPAIRKFQTRRVYVNGIDKIWAADLVDMQAFSKYNKGVKYLLTVVDIFSKYGWLIPLKNKTRTEVVGALQRYSKNENRRNSGQTREKSSTIKTYSNLLNCIRLKTKRNPASSSVGIES